MVAEEDPMPGLFHSDQKRKINFYTRGHNIYLTKKVNLSPECHTVVSVHYKRGLRLRRQRHSVLVEPKRNQTLLIKNRLLLHPGTYIREGHRMKVLITNFGDKSIELPKDLEVGTSHEGWEQQTPIMKVLEPVQPLPISPIQLAARRGYVIEQLKISENTMLQGEFDIQEKLIKLFIDNWNALSIRGSHGGLDTTTTNVGLEADTRPVHSKTQTAEPPHEATSIEQQNKLEEEYNTNRDANSWTSFLVPYRKTNGPRTFHWTIDYRNAHELTVNDRFPLASPNNRLHRMKGSTIFGCLRNTGPFRSTVSDSSRRETSKAVSQLADLFSVHLPMGPSKYPIDYSRLVHMALDRLPCGFALTYVDDIMLYSPTLEGHLVHVGQLLQIHAALGIKLRLNECHVFQQEVEYLGHLVSAKGIRMIPSYVERILSWPPPTKGKELENFLRYTGRYRSYIKEYTTLTREMNHAKHDLSINWTETMGSHFDTLKHKFQKGTIRGYPDFDNPEPLIIDTESSGFNITAALSQKQGDQEVFLGYVARTCHKSHQTYPEHSHGLCAAVLGLRGFEQALKRRAFLIRTDPLCREHLNDRGTWKGIYAKIQTFLSGFDYRVMLQTKKTPGDPDPPGKPRVSPKLGDDEPVTKGYIKTIEDRFNMYPTESFTLAEIRQAVQEDSTFQRIKEYVITGHEPGPEEMETLTQEGADYARILGGLSIHEGLIYNQSRGKDGSYKEKRVCLPLKLQKKAFKGGHIRGTSEHYAVHPTISRISWTFYFPNIYSYVVKEVLQCTTCKTEGVSTLKVVQGDGTLKTNSGRPIGEATYFGQQVYISNVTLSQNPQGFRGLGCQFIAIFQDNWSKYIQAIPVPRRDATTLTQTLLENWVQVYGCPEILYNYRGLDHISELFFELLSSLDICRGTTPVYSAEVDLTVESHRILRNLLQADPRFDLDDFTAKLALAVFAHNSTPIKGGDCSPYENAFGQPPVLPVDLASLRHQRAGDVGHSLVQDLRQRYYQNVVAPPEADLVGDKPELTTLSEDIPENEKGKERNTPDTKVTDLDELCSKERLGLATPPQ